MEEIKDLFLQRRKKAEELKQKGIALYPNSYRVSHSIEEIISYYAGHSEEDLQTVKERFSLAGRLMRLNSFGKAAFGHIQDRTGRIQGYFRRDLMDGNSREIFHRLDIGDIVGIRGKLFLTKTGELTLMVDEVVLLAKSLRPLPEKWHGLSEDRKSVV